MTGCSQFCQTQKYWPQPLVVQVLAPSPALFLSYMHYRKVAGYSLVENESTSAMRAKYGTTQRMPDKYAAVWVSHSSLSDFRRCPRSYYLKNMYKRPETGHKITLMSPALALGQAVHDVLENLSVLPTDQRLSQPLLERFHASWQKVSGKCGGFSSPEQEDRFKKRGEDMLRRVMANPGPIQRKAVKIKMDLPHYWLSDADSIILCGKVDWLEYYPDTGSVAIVDFKSGKADEDKESLQLPIYHLLAANCQKYTVSKAFYWYLDRNDEMTECPLPDLEASAAKVLEQAKQVKLARKLGLFKCPQGVDGCRFCKPLEKIVAGQAEFICTNDYNTDVYIINEETNMMPDSEIL